jgi:hypothetical protein
VDHETALEAANQALSGSALRPESRITSVELKGSDALRRGSRALPSMDQSPSRTREAWQIAAMIAVGVATLVLVISLWLI